MKRHGILLAFLAIASWANATRYYLKSSTDSPNAWEDRENVMEDINTAFGTLASGDELWIAKGTYTLTQSFSFQGKSVKIYGGFAGTEAQLDNRALKADATGPWDFENQSTITISEIDFPLVEITNSSGGTVPQYCVLYFNATQTVLDGLRFGDTQVTTAADLYLYRFASGCRDSYIRNCSFANNQMSVGTSTVNVSVLYLYDTPVVVSQSYFGENKMEAKNGAVLLQGGTTNQAQCVNCLFYANDNSYSSGAAISLKTNGNSDIRYCTFINHPNSLLDNKFNYSVYLASASSKISYCVFHDNACRDIMVNGGGCAEHNLLYNTQQTGIYIYNGTASYNAILSSWSVSPVQFATANAKSLTNNLILGNQIKAAITSTLKKITIADNLYYLKNGIIISGITEEEYETYDVVVQNNTKIEGGTKVPFANYGLSEWPTEAWDALKSILSTVTPVFDLKDKESFANTQEVSLPVSYTRSCYVDGYRESIILPFKPTDIKNASGESAKGDFIFERYVGRSTTEITFAERDFANLEANVPYLMRYKNKGGSGTAKYTFKGEGLPARPVSLGETFVGTYETVPYSDVTTRYVLAVDEVNSKDYFGKLAPSASIAPYRAYLELPADPLGAPARFSIAFGGSDEGGATGIEPAAQSDGLWGEEGAICLSVGQAQQVRIYGVDGRLVRTEWVDGQARLPMPQGLYLVNNRKVVVR